MTPEQRERVQEWFDALIDLSAEEQQKGLARYQAMDAEVASEVRRLLDGDQKEPMQIVGTELLPHRIEERTLAGSNLGPYKDLTPLGDGGFGVVYKAWRKVGQVRTPVAIKFLRTSVRDPRARQLFEQERQILADLDHPAIAKLLDGGTTAEGVPYLVMEFIDGCRITDYCDEKRLSIAERLRLFQKVCDAVSFAHRKQILHRDVKPPNVFVAAAGEVKLLDFGIAKLIGSAPKGGLETARGSRFFTRTHASPEQIRGERLSVGADIYSLGVLLYELLSGHLPFSLERVNPADWEALLLESPPTPPSEALEGVTGDYFQDVKKITASRRAGLKELQHRLRGDLDAIVLKALSKDPNRRFSTARALQDDIERYLVGMPVEARRWTARYRTGKAIRRAPALSAVFLLAFLVFLAGLGRSVLWGVRVGWQRQLDAWVIDQSRDLLYAQTLPVYRSLSQIDGSAETQRAFRQAWTELLQRFDRLPDGELAELQPHLGFAWLQAGTAYFDAAEYETAGAALDRAVERFASLYGNLQKANVAVPWIAGGTEALQTRRRQYAELYRRSLQARARLLRALGRDAEAARDDAAVAELEP